MERRCISRSTRSSTRSRSSWYSLRRSHLWLVCWLELTCLICRGFLQFLNGEYNVANAARSTACNPSFCFWVRIGALVNRDRVVFSVVSGGFFLALTAAFYKMCVIWCGGPCHQV